MRETACLYWRCYEDKKGHWKKNNKCIRSSDYTSDAYKTVSKSHKSLRQPGIWNRDLFSNLADYWTKTSTPKYLLKISCCPQIDIQGTVYLLTDSGSVQRTDHLFRHFIFLPKTKVLRKELKTYTKPRTKELSIQLLCVPLKYCTMMLWITYVGRIHWRLATILFKVSVCTNEMNVTGKNWCETKCLMRYTASLLNPCICKSLLIRSPAWRYALSLLQLNTTQIQQIHGTHQL